MSRSRTVGSRRRSVTATWLAALMALLVACGSASSSPSGVSASGSGSDPAAPQGTGVRGRVTDEAGQPVLQASVSRDSSDGRVAQSANVTGADGRYFLPLPPGTWRVSIAKSGFRTAALEIEVVEGEQVEQDVVLVR